MFLAWLKDETGRAAIVAKVFEDASKNNIKIVTSVLTISEVLNLKGSKLGPIRKNDKDKVRKLFREEWIVTIGLNRTIAELSQDIVWNHGIQPKDAIHIATALIHNVDLFMTYDNPLLSKSPLQLEKWNSLNISEPMPPEQGELGI